MEAQGEFEEDSDDADFDMENNSAEEDDDDDDSDVSDDEAEQVSCRLPCNHQPHSSDEHPASPGGCSPAGVAMALAEACVYLHSLSCKNPHHLWECWL